MHPKHPLFQRVQTAATSAALRPHASAHRTDPGFPPHRAEDFQRGPIFMTPTRPSHRHRADRLRLLAGALALCAVLPVPSQSAARKPAPPKTPAIADFTQLSGARPGDCTAPANPALSGMGEPTMRRCAWSQRVEMLFWRAIPTPAATCLRG